MTTEAHTAISKRLETMPVDPGGDATRKSITRSADWDEPFLFLPPERQAALLAELRTEQDIEAMSAGMGMPTVHRHFDWCIFADQGETVADCLNTETGVMECEGLQLSVPLTIENQTAITVMATASDDVAEPYLWVGTMDATDSKDYWLTAARATALGHYLIATAAMIGK